MITILSVAPGSPLPNVATALQAALNQNITDPEIQVQAGTPSARIRYMDSDACAHVPNGRFKSVKIKGIGKGNVRALFGITHSLDHPSAMPKMPIVKNPFKATSDKGMLTIEGDNVTLENLEGFGARSSSWNGAFVRVLDGANIDFINFVAYDNDNGILHHQLTGLVRLIRSMLFNNGQPGKAGNEHNGYFGPCDELRVIELASVASRGEGHEIKSRARKTTILNSAFADLAGNGSYLVDCCMGGELEIAGCLLGEGIFSANNIAINYILEDNNEGRLNTFNIHHNVINATKTDNGKLLRVDPRFKIDNKNGHDTYMTNPDGSFLQADIKGSFSDNIIHVSDAKNFKNTFGAELVHIAQDLSCPNIVCERNQILRVNWESLAA